MAALVDTNVLVYRFDPRDSRKQEIADSLLRDGIRLNSIYLPHQAIVEFVAACTRNLPSGPILSPEDAHLWAYAEHYGMSELYSEDFQHDRMYGTVRVVNPFV